MIHAAEYNYVQKKNGRYIVREIKTERGIIKTLRNIESDIPENSGKWEVVREYAGFLSAEEVVGQIIKVHMEGRMDV